MPAGKPLAWLKTIGGLALIASDDALAGVGDLAHRLESLAGCQQRVVGGGAEWITVQPLQRAAGAFGWLVVAHRRQPWWEPEEIAGLAGVAEVASLAVVYAEQQQIARDLEVLEDRHRIARDLHDHVIQRLFAVGMSIQTMLATPHDEDATIATPVSRLEQVVIGLNLWAWHQQREVKTRRDAITTVLKQAHPQVQVILDAPVQMRRETDNLRALAGQPGEADLETLMQAVASAWQGDAPSRGLAYDGASLSVALPEQWGQPQVMQFSEALQAIGFSVEQQGNGQVTVRRTGRG